MSAERPLPRPWLALVAALVAVAAGFAAWRGVLGWSLLGWDSYPMIHAGRVHDAASFFGTFTEELMDGRYPLGHFWRPLVHLAFALDHALFGLDPFGYHLTDLVVLLASAALVALLAERFHGTAGLPLGGLAAGLVFALHPLHLEVLPVAPRRADGLAVLFTLLALHAALGALRSPSRGRRHACSAAAGVACALALASKETGAIATAAVALLALTAPRAAQAAAGEPRLARAWRVAGPALVLTALTFALRTLALGGLGGGQESSLGAGLAHAPANAAVYARALCFPPALARPDREDPLPAALAIAGALALALLFVARGGARLSATALFQAGWALALVPLTGMSGLAQGWYAFPYLPVFALGTGLTASAARELAREKRLALALPSALAAAALVAVAVRASPFFEDMADFEHASRLEREFLAVFEERLAAALPGQALSVRDCPTVVQRVTHTATGERAYFTGPDQALDGQAGLERGRLIYVLASYSLEAFADLALGDGRARVSMPGLPPSSRATGPDVIDVTVLPPPLGFTRPDG
jgi:hypothetical protein